MKQTRKYIFTNCGETIKVSGNIQQYTNLKLVETSNNIHILKGIYLCNCFFSWASLTKGLRLMIHIATVSSTDTKHHWYISSEAKSKSIDMGICWYIFIAGVNQSILVDESQVLVFYLTASRSPLGGDTYCSPAVPRHSNPMHHKLTTAQNEMKWNWRIIKWL